MDFFKNSCRKLIALSIILFATIVADAQLVNPNSNIEALKLKAFLDSIYGKKIISGQAFEDVNETWLSRIRNASGGKQPAILSLDFMNASPLRVSMGTNPNATTDMGIDWVKNKGGILEMHWHWDAPRLVTGNKWQAFYTENTRFDVEAAMNDTTSDDYKLLIRDIDIISKLLLRMQDEGIALLWRPLHEAEGKWFWWGAKSGSACIKLYRTMYDRMVNLHGINNLIWVWTSYGTSRENWYPGDDVVDIVAWDYPDYNQNTGSWSQYQKLFGDKGKLFAIGEDSRLINPDIFEKQPWLYFVTWAYMINDPSRPNGRNTAEWINQVYNHPLVLTLDDLQPGPKANAGPSQTIFDFDGNAKELVKLDASHSYTNEGAIIKYVWKLNGEEIGVGINPEIELPIGTHEITLTIETDRGESKSAKVVIVVKVPSLTLNKKVEASSTEVGLGNIAKNAIDGDYATRWSSRYADPQWLMVDLEKRFDIEKVIITWEVASAKDFTIEQSNNGIDWVTVASFQNMPLGARIDTIDNLKGGARYIRMHGTHRNTAFGFSIFEFEVYGKENPNAEPVPENKTKAERINNKNWTVFPTVVNMNGLLTISSLNNTKGNIFIHNIKGALIKKLEFDSPEVKLTIDNSFKQGIYLLSIQTTDGHGIKRFSVI